MVEIVPLDDTLLVEAKIRPQDIAFLHPGQEAVVKFTAYDYTIYGGLKAKLERIGADTITDEDKKTTYYMITLRTDRSHLGTDEKPLIIIPGMVASVDIITGQKSILSYLLKPILRARAEALHER
jgi:adhesin transport system membrane fusion protein